MKVSKKNAIREDWDKVRSWNYKLQWIPEKFQSVVVAELDGPHGEVTTKNTERIYYILQGKWAFKIGDASVKAEAGDVVTIPAHTLYDYRPTTKETLKVILFMELRDN